MESLARPPIKAVAFDLDGTLIDSAPDLRAAINRMLTGAGRETLGLDAVKDMIGDGVQKLVERALEATGGVPGSEGDETLTQWVSRFADEYEGHSADLTRPYPGVVETLAQLRKQGYQMAVCTNKPQTATINVLEAFALSVFFDSVLGGDVLDGARKPNPRHLLATLDGLGVTPAEAVMVGDHLNDLACARAAGSRVVLCAYGYSRVPAEELGADAVIERLADLPAALKTLS